MDSPNNDVLVATMLGEFYLLQEAVEQQALQLEQLTDALHKLESWATYHEWSASASGTSIH